MDKQKVTYIYLIFACVLYGNLSWALNKSDDRNINVIEIIKYDKLTSTSPVIAETTIRNDNVRGCCVWKINKPTCSYTNIAYCRHRAKENNIKYDFYKGKPCKEMAICK